MLGVPHEDRVVGSDRVVEADVGVLYAVDVRAGDTVRERHGLHDLQGLLASRERRIMAASSTGNEQQLEAHGVRYDVDIHTTTRSNDRRTVPFRACLRRVRVAQRTRVLALRVRVVVVMMTMMPTR